MSKIQCGAYEHEEKEYDDWVYKCMRCQHCYKRKDDDDTLYCRTKSGCNFKPYKSALTEQKWKEVEEKLFIHDMPVKLKIDDYEITLIKIQEKMKLYIAIFVNGEFKPEWIEQDCDIRQRFMHQSKHCLLKKKELEYITKSKKKQQELKEKYTHINYSPYWSSFSRLKNWLIQHNYNIEFQ